MSERFDGNNGVRVIEEVEGTGAIGFSILAGHRILMTVPQLEVANAFASSLDDAWERGVSDEANIRRFADMVALLPGFRRMLGAIFHREAEKAMAKMLNATDDIERKSYQMLRLTLDDWAARLEGPSGL